MTATAIWANSTLARVALYSGSLAGALDHFKNARVSTGASEIASGLKADILWREGMLLTGLRNTTRRLTGLTNRRS